jgi:hypothetical protein
MLIPIGPLAGILAIVREVSLGAVVGEFDGEVASSRKLKEDAWRWRRFVTASLGLEPPLRLGQIIQGSDGSVGVLIVDGYVGASKTVHPLGPGDGVGRSDTAQCQQSRNGSEQHNDCGV